MHARFDVTHPCRTLLPPSSATRSIEAGHAIKVRGTSCDYQLVEHILIQKTGFGS